MSYPPLYAVIPPYSFVTVCNHALIFVIAASNVPCCFQMLSSHVCCVSSLGTYPLSTLDIDKVGLAYCKGP